MRDAAIVAQTISGYDSLDRSTEDRPVPDWLDGIERGPKGLRIGVPKQQFWSGLEPDVERLVRAAIASLESAGASVREVEFPEIEEYVTKGPTVMLAEAAAYHTQYFPARRDDYGPRVAALLDAGLRIPAVAYVDAVRMMRRARGGEADAVLEGVDVLAVPTVPVEAPTIASMRADDISLRIVALTTGFDVTGQPVLAVPCGLTARKLPASISFVGRRWDEAAVLWAGRSYEQVRGAFPAPPVA